MIDLPTLRKIARTLGLTNLGFAEKNYFQDILLLAVSREAPDLLFKGGTALYKLHGLERFSEDLDFHGRISASTLNRLARYLGDFGFPAEVEHKIIKGGTLAKFSVRGLLYQGTAQTLARIRFDVSHLDILPPNAEWKTCFPLYGDIPAFRIQALVIEEMLAEKVRALLVRSKARDAYDVWFLLVKGVPLDGGLVARKMEIYKRRFDARALERALGVVRTNWKSELGTMVPRLPDFGTVADAIRTGLGNLR
jgi:predicted nucleotidyltransferase component of viral defense system